MTVCINDSHERAAYERLKSTCTLPTPGAIAQEVLRVANAPDTDANEISRIVSMDPAISSRLLKIANSPLAGVSRPVASVQRAVVLLGARAVTLTALGFSLLGENRHGLCTAFDYDLFWSSSLANAVASQELANRLGHIAPDEAFTCGLLSQVGRLGFSTACPDTYAHLLTEAQGSESTILELEKSAFDLNHNELSAEMMTDWHLPGVVCNAVRIMNRPNLDIGDREELMAKAFFLANQFTRILTADGATRSTFKAIVNIALEMGIRPDQLEDLYDTLRQYWKEAGRIFEINTRNAPSLSESITQELSG